MPVNKKINNQADRGRHLEDGVEIPDFLLRLSSFGYEYKEKVNKGSKNSVLLSIKKFMNDALLYFRVELDGGRSETLSSALSEAILTIDSFETEIARNLAADSLVSALKSWSSSPLPPPPSAPELYSNRAEASENAASFLVRVYKPWLLRASIFQHQIQKLDPVLLTALNNQFRGNREELRALLPPKKAQTDKLLKEAGLKPEKRSDRIRAGAILRKARPT